MISLSDAIRLESGNAAVNTFKPWWEIWVDYTLNAFLLVVLFALAGVTISGTPGLVCLPTNTNITSLNFATNFYANAKCTTHVDGHVLIVFPYIIFAQWLILFVLHLSWFNLPALKAFLASSFDTFQVLKQEGNPAFLQAKKQSKKNVNPSGDVANLIPSPNEKDGDNDDPLNSGRSARLIYLVDWLQYLLQFRYNLVLLYTLKSIITCVLTAVLTVGLISWLVAFQWRTAFTCDLHDVLPSPFHHNLCSFPAAPYVYSMMILNVIFTMFLCVFNFQALLWLAKFRYKYRIYRSKKWQGNHPLKGKPGFYDYFFCIQLLKSNNAEGDVVFNTMEEAFEIFHHQLPEEKSGIVTESSLVIPETPNHCKNQFVLDEILRELGLITKPYPRNDLWAALANSLEENKAVLTSKEILTATKAVRERVVAVLLEKHALFKDLINKDDHCPLFEDYVEGVKSDEIREKGFKEDHYVFMAFSIAYKLNLVVVRDEKSSLLYEPEKPEINQSVKFLTFIPPRYYFATIADPKATVDESAGLKFLTDQIYQTELFKETADRWKERGYIEYKKRMEKMLPQELPYQPFGHARNLSVSEWESKEEGLRLRVNKSKSGKKKVEHFSLMQEAV